MSCGDAIKAARRHGMAAETVVEVQHESVTGKRNGHPYLNEVVPGRCRDGLGPMPRRKPIVGSQDGEPTRAFEAPRPKDIRTSNASVFIRLYKWMVVIISCAFGTVSRKLTGRSSVLVDAVMLREALESMGPTAIKVGQQLSIRSDILPQEYCNELSKMLDSMAPIPFDLALEVIERSLGCRLDEVFSRLDPEPIGSASLACVYQASLATGEKVAVKVKRPGIGREIHNDLQVIGWICEAAEWFGFLRPGLTRDFRSELDRMLKEELDYVLEARYTEIFRKKAKKNKHVTAPRVYQRWCSDDVIVSELISGVFMIEILNALEQQNTQVLEALKRKGYNLKKLARRMTAIFHWECYESIFFHADPHPANLIVRPNNTLVMIDFGSCGSISMAMRRKLIRFHKRLVADDPHGIAQVVMTILEPLPPIDTDKFLNELAGIYRKMFFAIESDSAEWYEKCSGWMWIRIIAACREYEIPINLDTLRIFRASFMYDSITYRLDPRLDPGKEFRRWKRKFDRKRRKRTLKRIRQRLRGPLPGDYTEYGEAAELVTHVQEQMQKWLDTPRYNFSYSVRKGAFVFSKIVTSLIQTVQLFCVYVFLRISYLCFVHYPDVNRIFSSPSGEFRWGRIVEQLFQNYFAVAFLLFLLMFWFIVVQKIIHRMDDVDTD